jgi:hypothetical protein
MVKDYLPNGKGRLPIEQTGREPRMDTCSLKAYPITYSQTFPNPCNRLIKNKHLEETGMNGKELQGCNITVTISRPRNDTGTAGMAKGEEDDDYIKGSAMMVEVDEDDDFIEICNTEYTNLNAYPLSPFYALFALSTNHDHTTGIEALIDSGCSAHLSNVHLPDERDKSTPIRFGIANGKHISSTGDRGSISGYTNTNSDAIFRLSNVNYVPEAKQTLISVFQLPNEGHDVWFNHSDMSANIGNIKNMRIVAKDFARKGVFPISIHQHKPNTACLSQGILLPSYKAWHQRMFHLNHAKLMATKHAVHGMDLADNKKDEHCESCILGKMHQYPHKPIKDKDRRKLGTVSLHLVFPPHNVPSLGGATCFLGISV